MTLSTVGGWVACRGAGQFSTRYGKIEDMVVGLDVALADGTDDHDRRLPPAGHRSRPHPAVRRLRGNARRHHRRSAPDCTRPRSPSVRGAWSFASLDDGLDACRRILQRGATPGRAPALRPDGVGPELRHRRRALRPDRPRRGRPGGRRRHVAGRRVGVRRGASALDDGARRPAGSNTATTSSQLEALIAGGLVVDTMEMSGRGRRCRPVRRRDRGHRRRSTGPSRSRPTAATATPTAPACTSPSPAGPPSRTPTDRPTPTAKDRYYRAVWDAGTRAVLGGRRLAVPPPRRRPQPVALHGRGARERHGPAGRHEVRARPERHPQPRQARAPVAVGPPRPPEGAHTDDRSMTTVHGPARAHAAQPGAFWRGVVTTLVVALPDRGLQPDARRQRRHRRGLARVDPLRGPDPVRRRRRWLGGHPTVADRRRCPTPRARRRSPTSSCRASAWSSDSSGDRTTSAGSATSSSPSLMATCGMLGGMFGRRWHETAPRRDGRRVRRVGRRHWHRGRDRR